MKHRAAAICAVVATALALAACGGGSSGGSTNAGSTKSGTSGAPTAPATIHVAVGQTIDSIAIITAAEQQGYFAAQRLDVKQQVMPYGPGLLSSVVSGQNQIAFAVTSDAIQAAAGGLPITMVAPAGVTAPDGGVVDALVVKRGGGIANGRDLEGKTIAVPVLKSLPVLEMQGAVRALGGDPSKVKFVALDFPSMLPALRSGKIAGAFLVEPFITASGAGAPQGPFQILYKNADATVIPKGTTASAWFAQRGWLSGNRDVAARFAKAIGQAQQYFLAHPDAPRAIVAAALRLPPALARGIGFGGAAPTINAQSVQLTADKMVAGGLIPKAPDMSQFVFVAGGTG